MKKILWLLCLLFSLSGYAQYYNDGQNPASIKWKSIDTEHFRIVFPEQAEKKARYIATLFTDLYAKVGKSMQIKPQKFTAILNSYSATSNGMVAWAPKRMELYAATPQNNEPQLWLNHLVAHEYRHVIQMNKITQGLTKIFNYILGEQATALVVGFYLPYWFLEGDAVCTETALTPVGRGRLPEFQQYLKAQLLEKGHFHYDKAVNGSFKDFVPNRYKLGYYMVGVGRANYGTELWENTLTKVGRQPFNVASFSSGIKQIMRPKRDSVFQHLKLLQQKYRQENTKIPIVNWQKVKQENTHGEGGVMLYYDVIKQLAWEWKIEDDSIKKTDFVILTPREKLYTNKRCPKVMENGDIIYLSKGLNNGLQFYKQSPTGKESKFFTPGYMLSPTFDYCNNKLLWAEQKPNIRWQKADKSVVVLYNIETNKRTIFKRKNSLFAPSFNASGNKFVAIAVDKKGNNSLLIIDTKTGENLQEIKCKHQEYYITPQWFDKKHILAVKINSKGKQLVTVNLDTKEEKILFQAGYHNIKNPIINGDYIYFSAGFTGIENLFAYSITNGNIYQITSSRFGACDIAVKGDYIFYADYTSDGYVLAKKHIHPNEWKLWNGKFATYQLAEKLTQQVGEQLTPDTLLMQQFQVKKYSKLAHLFHIHSWAPIAINTDEGADSSVDLGVSAAFQNELSSMQGMAGYRKKEGFQNGQFFANFSYRGWFPVIDTKIEYGTRRLKYYAVAKRLDNNKKDTLLVRTNCKNIEWKSSIKVPLNLSSGQFSRGLIPKITYNYSSLSGNRTVPLRVVNKEKTAMGNYQFPNISLRRNILEYRLAYYNFNKKAPRDVQNRFGQVLVLDYRHTPFGKVDYGNTWAAQTTLYFPGLAQHDGIKLYGGYQHKSNVWNYFSDIVRNPRGVSEGYYNHKWSGSINYAFTLGYPDFHIGSFIYFKRLKINAFYDFSQEEGDILLNKSKKHFINNFFSSGLELTSNCHLFHLSSPINMGIRTGYENQHKKIFADFIFRISLN